MTTRCIAPAMIATRWLLAAGALAALLGAWPAQAQAVRGAACNPAQRFDNPSCVRANASGVCRRVAGSCGAVYSAQCLDDPHSGKATKNLPLATNQLCNQFCGNQRGECEPAACNRDNDCRSGERCTQGWCQPATAPFQTQPAPPAGSVARPAEPPPREVRPELQRKKP